MKIAWHARANVAVWMVEKGRVRQLTRAPCGMTASALRNPPWIEPADAALPA